MRSTTAVDFAAQRGSRRLKIFEPATLHVEQEAIRIHLLDVSATGALAHAQEPVARGSVVTLECGELSGAAVVQWTDSGSFGIAFREPLGEAEVQRFVSRKVAPKKARAAPRKTVTMEASLRPSCASPFRVQVQDLSTLGFRIETYADLEAGADIWLRLPGLEPRQAMVVWAEGYQAGCAFRAPLHPAVVETIAGARATDSYPASASRSSPSARSPSHSAMPVIRQTSRPSAS